MANKPNKTCWHCLLAHALKELLGPVNIQVMTEVQVVPEPPRADLILLRREGKTWTKEQQRCLADGLRDTDAERLLIEFKYTESITEHSIKKLLVYDYLYGESEKLGRDSLQSFLVSAKTPSTDILSRYGFEPSAQKGVYISEAPLVSSIRVLLLNEMTDEPHNALLKCFSSRQKEKGKAFETMNRRVLPSQDSAALAWVTAGLLRVMMDRTLDNLELTGWTPDDVVKLGKEWIESKVIEFTLREGEVRMFLRLLQRRFGDTPTWAREKIEKADLPTLEEWSLRILDAESIEDVFRDQE